MAPKSLIRYEQVRRRGRPDVQETDAPYVDGRYFDANCLASDVVHNFVRITGSTGGIPDVESVDPTVPSTMPAVGVIIRKDSVTKCLVQATGTFVDLSGITPGVWYYVGLDSQPSPTKPALPAVGQVVGVGLTPNNLLLVPGPPGEAGGGGGADTLITGEVPSGAIDGSNSVFTVTYAYAPGTTRLFLNGVRQRLGASFDYVEGPGPKDLTCTLAPKSGDLLLLDYSL